ncbi:MAG: hypothetical protein JNL01_07895 [Bdellovibrionales bacterium]|nr:hypothetical protein [Bdellovibrionales bacterium]
MFQTLGVVVGLVFSSSVFAQAPITIGRCSVTLIRQYDQLERTFATLDPYNPDRYKFSDSSVQADLSIFCLRHGAKVCTVPAMDPRGQDLVLDVDRYCADAREAFGL